MVRNFKLNRRTMLRGMFGGSMVAVGLPLLEAMLDANGEALAGGAKLPTRFMFWYWADGIVIPLWEPAQVGATWALSEQLAPLSAVKNYITICSGLQNECDPDSRITHHEGMTGFSGYTINVTSTGQTFRSEPGGPSVDQRIADVLAGETPIRDVHVRVSKRESDQDDGSNAHAISHRGDPGSLTSNFPQDQPADVWDHLFGEFKDGPQDGPVRVGILDYVKEDVERLRPKLGMTDRSRLDAHLQGVEELAAKIEAGDVTCTIPDAPTVSNTDVGGEEPISDVNSAMAELIAYAFSCDLTRVATFMLKRFVSNTVFDEIGASNVHHNASHNGPNDSNYQDGITYSMEKFADLLEIFQNTVDARGDNLLDTTIIYASSDCSTGVSHTVSRQPIILAGHGRGYLVNPGIHYQATGWDGQHNNPSASGNMSDVLLTCLQAFDPAATDVGTPSDTAYSNTPLTDVLA